MSLAFYAQMWSITCVAVSQSIKKENYVIPFKQTVHFRSIMMGATWSAMRCSIARASSLLGCLFSACTDWMPPRDMQRLEMVQRTRHAIASAIYHVCRARARGTRRSVVYGCHQRLHMIIVCVGMNVG